MIVDRGVGVRPSGVKSLAALVGAVALVGACSSGNADRTRQAAELTALRAQIEELRKSQDAEARERAKLGEQVKALDAQQAFLLAEGKTSKEDLAKVQKALEQNDATLRDLRESIAELQRKAAAPPPSAPSVAIPDPRETSPDKLYADGMTSFRAEEHGQAVLEFTELVNRFPSHPLASTAQYWIGEAYYRQRDFRQALAEFQKVLDGYPQSPQVPEALVKIGLCQRTLKDAAAARESWERVVKSYPGSNAATQARSLLSQLGTPGRAVH